MSLLPATRAVNITSDDVLTSVTHKYSETFTFSDDDHNIMLKVRNSYTGSTLNLTDGLNVTFSTLYKGVVATPENTTVNIDGTDIVKLMVTYNLASDPIGTPQSETDYYISAEMADFIPPVFSGTISKEIQVSASNYMINFSSADFISHYLKNDGDDISSISISGSNPSFGAIMVGGSDYDFSTCPQININSVPANQNNAIFSFVATSTGSVSYNVSAFTASAPTTPIVNVVISITAYGTPKIKTPISDTTAKGAVMTFTDTYFTNHCDMSLSEFASVAITPTNTAYGTWYFGTAPFTTEKNVLVADLGSLTFSAKTQGDATFTWRISNTAGSFSAPGTGVITVTSPALTLQPYTGGSAILKGSTWTVTPQNFIFTPSASLSYIKIATVPKATDGYVYLTTALPKNDTYGYPALTANTALGTNAVIPVSYLSYLRLATKTTGPDNLITFNWTATPDLKISTATWATPVSYTLNFISGGALVYTTDMNLPLALSGSDISTQFTSLTGQALSYVTFTIPDKSTGSLYFSYDVTAKTNTAVAAATKYYTGKTPNLSNISFLPAVNFTGTATLTYNAYTASGVFITGNINIIVQNFQGGTFNLQMDKNSALQFDAGTFQASFLAATGKDLSYVVFSIPSTTYGTLYYNYDATGHYTAPVNSGDPYYVYSSPYLSLVSFVPVPASTGVVPLYFTGYTASGYAYSGKVNITIVDSPAGIVSYTMIQNSAKVLSGSDFSSEFVSVSGSLLSYVTITPPAATSGTLYYQYDTTKKTGTKVTAALKYYDGNTPDIADLTFIPAKDFVGTVVVAYKAYNAAGSSFVGKLKFIVTEGTQTIYYHSDASQSVTMNPSDFQSAFALLSGGQALSYVTFELPVPSYGRLYYNYTSPTSYDSAVSSDKQYSIAATPALSGVTFVPTDGYSGSFTFSYTGYTSGGASYTGKIRIVVASLVSASVNYSTNALTPVTFNATDFSNVSGAALSYVIFTLPYSAYGTLYGGYTSASSVGWAVPSYSAFYTGSSPSISSVTFVPNSSFSGVLAIAYTAYKTSGVSTSGTVLITVTSRNVDTVSYSAPANASVVFNADDFNMPFLAKSGSSLSYVVFGQSSFVGGQLYLGYNTPDDYTSVVTPSVKFYTSYSPLLSNVSFVPNAGFTGSVTIPYTGYTTGGAAYIGKIIVNISSIAPFADIKTGYDWASGAVSYLFVGGVVKGTGDGQYHPSDYVTRGDFILMVTRAFALNSYSSDNFFDVPLGVYYYSAVATAKYYGIVTGSGEKFYPTAYISRQDAMVILSRALSAKGIGIAQGDASDLSAFTDASDISDYAVSAMASLVKAGAVTGMGGMLNPKSMITRAEMAVILYKVMTM